MNWRGSVRWLLDKLSSDDEFTFVILTAFMLICAMGYLYFTGVASA